MYRTLIFNLNELWHDQENVAARVNHACAGGEYPCRVRGMAQISGQIYVFLLPAGDAPGEEYVLAPWEDESVDGVAAELSQRWAAGFDLVGSVRLEEGRYALLLAKGAAPGT